MSAQPDEIYWQAVLDHDGRYDGTFVYAVPSTGVYCRPSCPSRRPRREGVRFFAVPTEAAQAHFRPCKRCRPGDDSPSPDLALVQKACRLIEQQEEGTVSLTALGTEVGLSPHHLQRTFKRVMGITPRQYAEAYRVSRLKDRLRAGDAVTGALYEVGYGSSSRLYEQAPAHLGMTPGEYRRGGLGMHIAYTIVGSPLGRLMVAATDRGICAVSLGDDDAALEAALTGEYPAAEIRRDAKGLGTWVAAIVRHLEGSEPHLDLPLDLQGTAFQWRVRELLRAIPYGSTLSYSDLARELGQPGAARAVARVCATNPVALVLPCHRVVRQDGDLGGYRWGVERKRALLAHERDGSAARYDHGHGVA
jgi:AraC family transcriptional regulator of adaptative response/methylated-DNA-[protein]-cysteine methyltransferase